MVQAGAVITGDMMLSLQLRDHFRRVPVGPDALDLAILIDFKDVDTFESYFLAAGAGSLPDPLHRGAVAGHEHGIFRQPHALEVLADRIEEFTNPIATND